jgi:PAS domain S-box-containing protein
MSNMIESTWSPLLEGAPEAILAINVRNEIIMANRKAEQLFGFAREEIIGKPVGALIPLEYREGQDDSTGILLSAQRSGGGTFLAEVSVSMVSTPSDSSMIVIVRDVSARSEVEAERVRLKSVAEDVRLEAEAQLVKAKGEKTVAEDVRLEAEAQLVKAEGEKTVAEKVRLDAEAQRLKAEGEKTIAERVRLVAEAQLVKAEGEKSVAESVRLDAEAERVKAEGEKTIAERVRLVAEAQLVKAEGEKSVAESVRLDAEAERVKAESEKAIAESVRLTAEVQRIKAENEKIEAERVRLEADVELERLKGLLHQSQRMESLGQLAGGVAHDFNNLLAVILNYASFVSEELTSAVTSGESDQWQGPLKDVQQIQVAAERASVLTHQLLAFARREVVQARALSFNEAVTNIEEMLRRTIGEQIELSIDLEANLSRVMADPGHIEQIILNLAINARDAMPLGGTLAIETSSRDITEAEWMGFGVPAGSYVCVRFSDNGVGMSSDVRDRAFEPFFTTKPRGEGSGLGLATVYGIVLQSGGFTKIYSDEGVGTSITILLPMVESGADTSDQDVLLATAQNGVETILVVDDEEGLREVTRRILHRSGYVVLTASSGDEAIEIASNHKHHIDLLLTDVIMAKMQGPTVAAEVRKLLPDIKVLFMSGHAQPVLEAEAVLGTEFQLIEKPFDQKMLLTNVRIALDREKATNPERS